MALADHPVFVVMAVAALAPLLAELPKRLRVPVVVLEVLLGIAVGPHGLGWLASSRFMDQMSQIGMATLLFMAGMEIDFSRIRGRPLLLGLGGWALSLLIGLAVVALLHRLPGVHAPLMATLALATTGLGVLLPVLRDGGQLDTACGRLLLAAGTVGEPGPIVLVSLLLSQRYGTAQEFGLLLVFLALMASAAAVGMGVRPPARAGAAVAHDARQHTAAGAPGTGDRRRRRHGRRPERARPRRRAAAPETRCGVFRPAGALLLRRHRHALRPARAAARRVFDAAAAAADGGDAAGARSAGGAVPPRPAARAAAALRAVVVGVLAGAGGGDRRDRLAHAIDERRGVARAGRRRTAVDAGLSDRRRHGGGTR